MGDAADWAMEQEFENIIAHQFGDCDDWCPLCSADDAKARKEKRARKAAKRKSANRSPTADEREDRT